MIDRDQQDLTPEERKALLLAFLGGALAALGTAAGHYFGAEGMAWWKRRQPPPVCVLEERPPCRIQTWRAADGVQPGAPCGRCGEPLGFHRPTSKRKTL